MTRPDVEASPSLRLATEARGRIKRHRQAASARAHGAPAAAELWLHWYLRISDDAEQRGLGVERQRKDGYAMADRLGIPRERVVFYRDNDRSGADFTARADYDRLLLDVEKGAVSIIGASETSRLAREGLEQEELYLIAEFYGVRIVSTDGADVRPDAEDADDKLAFTRIKGAVDKLEQAKIRRRTRKKHLELAMAGKLSGGGPRPFGFEDDRVTLVPEEAALIAEGVGRLLAGERLGALTTDWRERGVTTPGRWRLDRDPSSGLAVGRRWEPGHPWQETTLRRMLRRYRNAGWRSHHDVATCKGEWPAIVSLEQIEALRALLDDPSRRTNGKAWTKYLLSGLGWCALCEAKLIGRPNNGAPGYRCPPKNRGGCHGVYIQAAILEEEVQGRFFAALSDEAMMAGWRDVAADDVDRAETLAAIEADEAALDNLANALGDGLDRVRYRKQVARVTARLEANRRLLRSADNPATMVAAAGGVGQLMADWPRMPVGQRQAKLATAIDWFTVDRTSVRGSKKFDPGRVAVRWVDGVSTGSPG